MFNTTQRIKNISLISCLLCLAASAPMEMAAQSYGLRGNAPTEIYSDLSQPEVFGIWKNVATGDVMKRSFVHRQPNHIARIEKLHTVFDTLCLSGRPLRVLHLGDSHVASKSFPLSIKQNLYKALGAAENDSAGTGIYFSYMAKNGATALKFLTPQRQQDIKSKNPDLIILSFGTNECHGMGYLESVHLAELRKSVNTLRSLCPKATILLTTPPGDYLSQRVKYYVKRNGKRYRRYRYVRKPNPMSKRCAALICKYAEQEDMAVWDLNTIAGGSTAVRNWTSHRMMRPDHVHFTPEGYNFQGKLLGEALLKAYNHYIDKRNTSDIFQIVPPFSKN